MCRFGENLDGEVVSSAEEALETCDLFMTIGTSSVVYPAAGFAAQVRSSGLMLSHAFGACHAHFTRLSAFR